MTSDAPMIISEWDWFKLQLRLHALERRGTAWVVRYTPQDKTQTLGCSIWSETTQGLIDRRAPIDEQRSFYDTWAPNARRNVEVIVREIPHLRYTFDVMRDMVVEIVYDYGMGSSVICRYRGDEWTWNYGDWPPADE
jgi:hypothetical protein